MINQFDSFCQRIISEGVTPIFMQAQPDGTYTFVNADGNPELGGKNYDKATADRILKSNNDRIRMEQELQNAPEEPEEEFEPLTIRGEYWFDEAGDTMYADGDVGDMNHEAYVIQRCGGEVAGYFNIDLQGDEGLHTGSNAEEEIVQEIIDDLDHPDEETIEDIRNDPANAIINYLTQNTKMKPEDVSELVMIAYGSARDARKYAIEKWNWSRVHRNSIEVNSLTKHQLEVVAKGINNALSEEGLYEDEEWERAGKSDYNISTYTGRRYTISLDDMLAGNTAGLEQTMQPQVHPAGQQVRQMDIAAMPDYYKAKGIIGDSFSFTEFYFN